MYDHGGEHLRAEFDRIEVILDRARTLGDSTEDGVVSQTRLDAFVGRSDTIGATDTDVQALTEEIAENVARSHENGVTLRFEALSQAFGLSRAEKDVLLFVLGPEVDRSITKVYGQIGPADTAMLPSVELVETLLTVAGYDETGTESNDRTHRALSPSSPLFAYDIIQRAPRDDGRPASYDVLSVDERIVGYLKGNDTLDSKLRDTVAVEHHGRTLSELVFDEQTTARLEALQDRLETGEDPAIVFITGADGTGKDRLPGALTDDPLLRVHAADVCHSEEMLTRLFRETILHDAALHVHGLETVTDSVDMPAPDGNDPDAKSTGDLENPTVDDIVARFDDVPCDIFLDHTENWTPDVTLETHCIETVDCPFPDHTVRETVWKEYAGEFADDELVSQVATNFRLSQRDIRQAVRTARYLYRTGAVPDDPEEIPPQPKELEATDAFDPVDGKLTRAHLYEACKRYSANNLEALAERIEPGYTRDDIVLNNRQQAHLKQLCGHLQYRGAVTSEWGFDEPGSRGDGVIALFYGQPGTGKTMAAEIIANETGLDLYRADLSQIIDKYVGETEDRLATLLDEAERSNAILLFDEADAIFGERTEVSDATDRYANTEINFLLQRLESFDGILLLTTNQRSGIDSAFKRRIHHAIAFEKPQKQVRRELWMEVFPDEANVATEEIDYEFLSTITTTPALIRKVATYAAYIAVTEAHDGLPFAEDQIDLSGVTITFDHIIRALQYAREAGGAGFEVEFGEYADRRRNYGSDTSSNDWRSELRRVNANTSLDVDIVDANERDPADSDR